MENEVQGPVRGDGFDPERKALFVVALRHGHSVLGACRMVGVSNRTAYNHRRDDPAFAEAWALARKLHSAPLELEAYRRAVEGEEEPVYAYGRRVGPRRRQSDSLLARLLERERPELYGRSAGARTQGKLKKRLARLAARVEALEARLGAARLRSARNGETVNFVNPRRRVEGGALRRERRGRNWRLDSARRRSGGAGISPNRVQP